MRARTSAGSPENASAALLSERAPTVTNTPLRANCTALSNPTPEVAPVIRANLPFSLAPLASTLAMARSEEMTLPARLRGT